MTLFISAEMSPSLTSAFELLFLLVYLAKGFLATVSFCLGLFIVKVYDIFFFLASQNYFIISSSTNWLEKYCLISMCC